MKKNLLRWLVGVAILYGDGGACPRTRTQGPSRKELLMVSKHLLELATQT